MQVSYTTVIAADAKGVARRVIDAWRNANLTFDRFLTDDLTGEKIGGRYTFKDSFSGAGNVSMIRVFGGTELTVAFDQDLSGSAARDATAAIENWINQVVNPEHVRRVPDSGPTREMPGWVT